ncbi:trigger factor [Shumkonia mesophila]|uniref:trigger factor n=1 Tax=Shumkonia mesophila TaxID=2838854 RepID=UPI002934C742|nr:trigger factor [Shumkonia mesophila]
MQVTETKTEGLKRDFKIVVPATDIENRITARLEQLSQTLRIPGFRPGKVPVSLLRKRYGSSVMGEVLERTVGETTAKAMTEHGVRPAMQPKVEITSFEEGKDLEYTMAVEVLPEIAPVDFSKIELERLTVDVEDSEIDEVMQRMAEANKVSEPVAGERAAAKGDVVVIDFVGKVDDKEFPGGKADGYHLDLGSGSFIPGFEDQLVGAKAGDHVAVSVAFPKEYGAADLAGKDAVFDVDVKEVRSTKPATIDDDFAKKAGLENLDGLKKAIRDEHEREFKAISRLRLKRALLDALAEMYDFAVPDSLVEAELNSIWAQFEEQRKQDPDAAKKEYGDKSDDDIKAEFRAIAERRIRLGLVLAEVGQTNKIQVTQDDINRAVVAEARRYPGQEQKVIEYYKKNPEAMDSLRAPLIEDRVVDFMLEMAKLTERKVTREELLRDPDEDEAGKAAAPAKDETKKKPAKKASAKKDKGTESEKA